MTSLLLGAFLLLAQPPAAQVPVIGDWEGTLQTPGGSLRIRIHVTAKPDGSLDAKMDSPDQNAFGIPADAVTFVDGVFKWGLAVAKESYEGKPNAAGTEIAGTFKQGAELPLVLKRMAEGAAARPTRPQDPKPPLPYTSEDVTFPSKAAGVTLAGTLTLPPGKGPFPAVILITGSGAQDRDEALMGHRPFLVLSDHLTRNGIAVLRYDDRGVAKSTGKFATATTTDFSRDAEGALDFLEKRAEIDAKKIGLAGHSEGGVVAPMVAARRADTAYIVMLAGTGVPGKDIMLAQAAKMNAVAGTPPDRTEKNAEMQRKIFAILAEDKDDASARAKIKEVLAGVPSADAQARQSTSPWMREFAFYDPSPTLEKVKCPVLAVNGSKDLQVIADQNLPTIEAALKKGGNKDIEVVRLPDLNHLFQTANSGLPTEYGQIDQTISPVMLTYVTKWIRRHTGLDK